MNEDTDIAAELGRIDGLAKKHHLEDAKTIMLKRSLEGVLSDLKKQGADSAVHGIQMAIKTNVSAAEYDIAIELHPRNDSGRKSRPLSRLFGR